VNGLFGLGVVRLISAESLDRARCGAHTGSFGLSWLQKPASLRRRIKVFI
jgi:hypothetical protein